MEHGVAQGLGMDGAGWEENSGGSGFGFHDGDAQLRRGGGLEGGDAQQLVRSGDGGMGGTAREVRRSGAAQLGSSGRRRRVAQLGGEGWDGEAQVAHSMNSRNQLQVAALSLKPPRPLRTTPVLALLWLNLRQL